LLNSYKEARETGCHCASRYGRDYKSGTPALFSLRVFFTELIKLNGDTGAGT